MYNFNKLNAELKKAIEWLQGEMQQIRTGRANPGILDGIHVEAYDSKMPITQVASITAEDARTLRVTPYDPSVVKNIERAIQQSDVGLGIAVDDKGLRLTFPSLTTERRQQFVKIAKDRLEQARISLRTVRDEIWQEIQAKEKEGGMGEDQKFRLKEQMETLIKQTQTKLEEMFEKKEADIMSE